MRKRWWILAGVAILIVIVFFFIRRNSSIPVTKIELQQKIVKKTVSASGTVKSSKEADLAFVTAGRITTLNIKKGDAVNKGAYLGSIYSVPSLQSAQAAKDARDIALRNLDLHILQIETKKDTLGGQAEYDSETRRLNELVSKAEAEYQAALGAETNYHIYAPFSGTVIAAPYEVGEVATAGTTAVKLADLNDLIFEIELDQEDFGLLNLGQKVDITLDAFDKEIFAGEVTEIPYFADGEESNVFIVIIKIVDEEKEKILLGMTGDAYIVLQTTESEVQALAFDEVNYDVEDKTYVFVLENGRVKRQYINVGIEGDIYTQILSDITNPIIQPQADNIELEEGKEAKITE